MITFLDKIIGSDYKKNFYILFQVKFFRFFGYLFEAVVFSSIVTLIVGLICMLFTKNEGIINTIGTAVYIFLILSSYKSNKEHFLIFEKMLKAHVLNEKAESVEKEK
jgi:hypothetical protein